MPILSKTVIGIFFFVAFIGFLDASFLTAKHFSGEVPPCFLTSGCDVVTTSTYSKFLGIPVALMGLLYYLAQLVLMMYYIDKKKNGVLPFIALSTVLAFVFSLWLTYTQIFLIESYCSYCLFSATTSTILFGLGVLIWRAYTKNKNLQISA